MGIVNYTYNRTTSGGEIIRELVNSTDGQGLHFDGAAGYVDIASPPDLGTKFSFEFIFKATTWTSGVIKILVDFEGSGSNRFMIRTNASGNNLKIYDGTTDVDTGVVIFDDLKVHHVVVTIDGTAAVVYDNGNQVGSATISASHGLDNATDARIGSDVAGRRPNGTYYRTRFWNKTLTAAEVTTAYENATVPFADQWGVATNKISGAVDKNWGTAQSDTGNDTNDRATFNTNYVWDISNTPIDISVASNVLTFSSAGVSNGINYPGVLTAGKSFRATINVGSITGSAVFKLQYYSGSAYVDVHTLVSGSNTVEFTPAANNGRLFIVSTAASAGTIALNATAISNEIVASGVVADLDLAFANPSPSPNGQSLQIQDRSTNNVKGTASATGVTQVTPIEQLNAKAARIGTTAATPADGELLVSGNAQLDGSVYLGGTANNADKASRVISNQYASTSESEGYVVIEGFGSSGANRVDIGGGTSAHNAATAIDFYTAADATTRTGTKRLTIDSAGNVGIGGTPTVPLDVLNGLIALKVGADSNVATRTNATDKHGRISCCHYTNAEEPVGIAYVAAAAGTSSLRIGGGSGYLNAATEVAFYTAANTTTANGTARLTIDSAGLATFSAGITVSAGTANFAGSYLNVGGGYGATGLSISDAGVLQADGLATFSGGIVETNGVLKSNLLTNSGFDCWSNSTLETVATIKEDDCASDDTGDWTKVNSGLSFDTDHYEYTASNTGNSANLTSASYTAGKLYRTSLDVKNGAGSTSTLQLVMSDGSAQFSPAIATTGSFVTHTFVFEAATTTGSGSAGIYDNTHFSSDIEFKNFSLKEVTPGCVNNANKLAFDGWERDNTVDIWRHHNDGGTLTRDGSFYSLKTTTTATNDWVLWPPAARYALDEHIQRFAGRTVTFGCWAKTSDASHAKLKISDGTETFSDYHTGGGAWEWLEVTKTIASNPTNFYAQIFLSLAAKDAYFSQPMLVFGSAIGSGNYSRPSGEIVWCEAAVGIQTNVSPAAADDKILNLEALSNGKIPKGAQSINLRASVRNSSVTSSQGVEYGPSSSYSEFLAVLPSVNGFTTNAVAWVDCDSNGDIYQKVTEADATLAGLYNTAKAVQLR